MKKKILAIVLCVAMLAIAIVGGTMAYFTDTQAQENVFTAGKVEIALTEAVVEKNEEGNLVAVAAGTRTSSDQAYHLFPAQTVTKDPTITVASDSEDAFIAAKVTITNGQAGDLADLIGSGYMGLLDVTKIVSGGYVKTGAQFKTSHPLHGRNSLPVYGDGEYAVYQQIENGAYVLYIFVENAQTAGASVTLFNTVSIPAEWDNAEMAIMNGLSINIKAFATQTNGFENCYEAMTTAFATEFNFG